ncbi:MAG: DUF2298 domain-containing protein [Clostridia bacterium]|nr:DUF2298 domain-containing protein [Clostridia bacterium]
MQKKNTQYQKFDADFDPLRLLLLFVPFLVSSVAGLMLCGNSDFLHIELWLVLIFVIGVCALPITFTLFKNFYAGSYLLTKPIGILATALVVWTLGYMKIPAFSFIGIWIVLFLIAAISYFIKPLRANFINKISNRNVFNQIIWEETFFSLVFVVLCFYKGFLPNINGEEKFMDYGFIMSMLRSDVLPANDMWLAGYKINYYYFGQFIYALLTKMSSIPTGYAYNLSMCTSIAIPFVMAYTVGSMLTEAAEFFSEYQNKFSRYITGILAAFTVIVFGNSHSFFYDTGSLLGQAFLKMFSSWGINVGNTTEFFYPNSTRYIGHNPDLYQLSETGEIIHPGDYTIHEFPFYSYLVGDLHAHVVSMMVVLLIMALCIVMISKARYGTNDEHETLFFSGFNVKGILPWLKNIITPELITAGILLGIAQMCNYWDFLIYFIFIAMTLLVVNTKQSNKFSTIFGAISFVLSMGLILGGYLLTSQYAILHTVVQLGVLLVVFFLTQAASCALSTTTLGMSFVFAVAHIVALLFNANFDMISNSLGKVQYRSSPFQLWILWGTHVTISLCFVVFTIIYKNYRYNMRMFGVKGGNKQKDTASELAGISYQYTNPIQKFFGDRNLIDIFVCGMIVVGLLLLIAPEIFYVRDIYTGGYLRSNTMFKFTFAAFIILSVAIAYALIRMIWIVNKNHQFSNVTFPFAVVFIIILFAVPGHYTGIALQQRCGDITRENYQTLDGTKYLETYASQICNNFEYNNMTEYNEAIKWMNENIEGSPVIVEAYGTSYTDHCIVSAYTGLQTVCGWQTHEWLWRFHGIVDKETDLLVSDPERDVWKLYLTPRHNDVDTVYQSYDTNLIKEVLGRYDAQYIVYGDLERNSYPGFSNIETLKTLGSVVFEYDDPNNSSGPVYVIKVA